MIKKIRDISIIITSLIYVGEKAIKAWAKRKARIPSIEGEDTIDPPPAEEEEGD